MNIIVDPVPFLARLINLLKNFIRNDLLLLRVEE